MSTHFKNQRGTLAFEIALCVIVVVAVGAIGYMALTARQAKNDDSVLLPHKKTVAKVNLYKDSEGYFSAELPPGWVARENDDTSSGGFLPNAGGKYTTVSKDGVGITISKNLLKGTPGDGFNIQNFADYKQQLRDSSAAESTDEKDITVNGQTTFYFKQTVANTPPSGGYTDVDYHINKGDIVVAATFRQKAGAGEGAAAYDHTSYLSDYEKIVKSIKILK